MCGSWPASCPGGWGVPGRESMGSTPKSTVRNALHGVRCLVSSFWYFVSGVRCLVSGVWCLVSNVRCLASGVWCLVSGV